MRQYFHLHFPLIVIIILLIASSFFVSVNLNGGEKGSVYIWSYEITLIDYFINKNISISAIEIILCSTLLLLHAGVCLLPFFINKKYFSKALIYIPLLFIIFQMIAFVFIGFLLLPFFILWIISLIVCRRVQKPKTNAF